MSISVENSGCKTSVEKEILPYKPGMDDITVTANRSARRHYTPGAVCMVMLLILIATWCIVSLAGLVAEGMFILR